MVETVTSGWKGVLPNSNFVLSIGNDLLSFSKVSNISRTMEYETFNEGGLNTMVRSFTKPKQQQEILVLEKGVSVARNKIIDVYTKLGLLVGKKISQAVILVVLGDDDNKDRFYTFDEGIVVKWELGDLDALRSEVLVERFEIAHSGLIEQNPPEIL
jgi:phage tail-like protein